ncbi:T-box transcription factor mls-1-like [Schistocerca gregaria]|uniref:T-box transcription factor mls-1-like n=1 Tax=Schistocerca gregaria TaxID=7010 RepID=UPI00211DFD78|nr:T-box transcription factor mls-1-like [Schistocerca gregaria]
MANSLRKSRKRAHAVASSLFQQTARLFIRIFPELKVCVSGLEAGEQYVVALGARLSCGQRFRFHKGRWAAWGRADPPRRAPARNLFLHAGAPADGRHWSRGAVSLYAAKLTNDPASSAPPGAQILVSSMHKYVPVVHIFKTSSLMNLETCQKASFSFPEAEFIAVTAYQNDDLAALKIRNNPFAKAFRNKLTRRQSNVDLTEVSSATKKTSSEAISVPAVASPLVEAIVRPVPVFHWPVHNGLSLEYLSQCCSYYQRSSGCCNMPSFLYPRLSYKICGCICDHKQKHFDTFPKDVLQ